MIVSKLAGIIYIIFVINYFIIHLLLKNLLRIIPYDFPAIPIEYIPIILSIHAIITLTYIAIKPSELARWNIGYIKAKKS